MGAGRRSAHHPPDTAADRADKRLDTRRDHLGRPRRARSALGLCSRERRLGGGNLVARKVAHGAASAARVLLEEARDLLRRAWAWHNATPRHSPRIADPSARGSLRFAAKT